MVSRRVFLGACAGVVSGGAAGCLSSGPRVTMASVAVLDSMENVTEDPSLRLSESGQTVTIRGIVYTELSCQDTLVVTEAFGREKDVVLGIAPSATSEGSGGLVL